MKKFLVFAVMAAMVLFTGCKKTPEFNKALTEDYASVIAEYPEARLYEVQTEFNDEFTTRDRNGLHIVTAREIYQVDPQHIFEVVRNFEDGTCAKSLYEGFWTGDVVMTLDGLHNINEALDALFKSDIIVPETNLMTLRNPLVAVLYPNAFYIFGSTKTSFVAVDGVTLEVQEF